jgi:hypothetical protein
MEELIPYLRSEFNINFVRRTRGWWSKTFGLAKQIYRCNDGFFHVNYALQDAYLVSKLKHLDILHVHGSDLRWTLNSRRYGWIVRSNIAKAKTVLFSTPDLLSQCESLVDYPVWLPTPVNTEQFKPVQQAQSQTESAPCAVYFEKWYEKLPPEIPELCKKYGIKLWVVPRGRRIAHDSMALFLNFFDIFIDRFCIVSDSKTCLEAQACGLAKIPLYGRTLEWCFNRYADISHCRKDGLTNRDYVKRVHESSRVAEQLAEVWRSKLG